MAMAPCHQMVCLCLVPESECKSQNWAVDGHITDTTKRSLAENTDGYLKLRVAYTSCPLCLDFNVDRVAKALESVILVRIKSGARQAMCRFLVRKPDDGALYWYGVLHRVN